MSKNQALLIVLSLLLFTSWSQDMVEPNEKVIGSWKLISYDIGTAVDINGDGNECLNFLDELTCKNNEILVFEPNGVMSSKDTFNPTIKISKSNEGNTYSVDVECSEGVIGFATAYTVSNDAVKFNDKFSTISGHELTRVLENAIDIYSEDLSEVVEVRDLMLKYKKQ